MELLGRTERAAQSAQWPLELIQLFNLPFPHFLGNDREPGHNDFWGWHLFDKKFPLYYSLYMGVGTLLLFLFGLRKPWDRRQKILLLTFFLFFLLSCGRYSPFFFSTGSSPCFLRSGTRSSFSWVPYSVCLILAAFGFDGSQTPGSRTGKPFSFMAVCAGLGLSLFRLFKRPTIGVLNKLFIIDQDASFREFGRSIGTGLVLLAVYALVFFLLHRSKGQGRILGWALIALAVLDPAYHNRYVNPTVPASFYDKPPLPGLLTAPLAIYRDELYSHRLLKERGIELVPVNGERRGEEAREGRLIIERGRHRRVDISVVISGIQDGEGDKCPAQDPASSLRPVKQEEYQGVNGQEDEARLDGPAEFTERSVLVDDEQLVQDTDRSAVLKSQNSGRPKPAATARRKQLSGPASRRL